MRAKFLHPAILLAIIGILGAALVYQVWLRHKAWKAHQQFMIASYVLVYQELDHGDTAAAKRRLGALVTTTFTRYEREYGQRSDPSFKPRLAEAKAIRAQFEAETPLWQGEVRPNQ